MMLYPDAQKAAQKEIDALLQGERLPTLDDKDSLPHIQAIIKEVVRWNPVIPTGSFTPSQTREKAGFDVAY